LWETEEGRRWFLRLIVAVRSLFGLKRGGGAETMREFFARLHLERHVGCSPSALRGMMEELERVILQTVEAWEGEGVAGGEARPIIGAVDETFLERMMVVFMDLVSGYLVVEAVADDRTYETWNTLVEARLEALGVRVLYLVSDRAKPWEVGRNGLDCQIFRMSFPASMAWSSAMRWPLAVVCNKRVETWITLRSTSVSVWSPRPVT
jgi:hypothetical protein